MCRIQSQIESNSHFAHLIHKAGADEGALEADEDYGLWTGTVDRQVQMPVIALETTSTNCNYAIKVDTKPNA